MMSGSNEGWVKFYRRLLNSAIWQNHNLMRFWTWCLLKATHDGYTTTIGYSKVTLEPGQFLYNHSMASMETGMSLKVVRTCIESLRAGSFPEIGQATGSLPGNRFSVVTILNWADYQNGNGDKGSKRAGKRASKGQAEGSLINNEGKNVKKYTGVDGVFDGVPEDEMPKTSKKSPAATDSQTWRDWVDACRQCGRPDPAPSPAAVKAAATLAEWVADPDELFSIMAAYLRLDDPWIRRQGYQLALLVNHRFEAAREAATKTVAGNESLDALGAQMMAEEKRRQELNIPDWEECPA